MLSNACENGTRPCPLHSCSKEFKKGKSSRAVKHFKKHHPSDWILTCAHCPSFFTRNHRKMARHVKKSHDRDSLPYFCNCHSSCPVKDIEAFEECQFPVQYTCTLCEFSTFKGIKKFNRHIKKNHFTAIEADIDIGMISYSGENDTRPCPLHSCSKEFKKGKSSRAMKHFKKHHSSDWILTCAHCPSFFTRNHRKMARHVKKSHDRDSLPYFCNCHSSCPVKDIEAFEECQFPIQYACTLCEFSTFKGIKRFNRHIKKNHSSTEAERDIAVKREIKSEGDRIVKALKTSKLEPLSPESFDDESLKEGLIKMCQDLASEMEKEHSLNVRTDIAYEPTLDVNEKKRVTKYPAIYPCPECGKYFTRERNVRTHMVVHSDERPFKCDLCPYNAKRKQDIDEHVFKVHQKARPYVCDICSKAYSFSSNLRRHSIKHKGTSEYKCKLCPKFFVQGFNLRRHMKTVHKMRKLVPVIE